MSKTALIGGPQVLAAAVVAVALAAVGALAIITGKTPEAPAPLAALPAPVESAPAAAPAPAPAEPVAAPAVEAPQERAMPAFDVVRVDAEGNATIAGRAEAGDQVALLLDGLEIAKAAADGAGAFVFLTTLPPADVPRSLSLQATGADGAARVSDVEAIVAPFAGPVAVAAAEAEAAKPEEAATEAAPETTAETAAAAGEASESAATAEVAAAGSTTAEAAASAVDKPLAAPAVVMAGPQGIEVKQAASAAESLAIDAISYTDTGDVEIAGRAPGRGFVRLYLDNKAVTESKIAEDGTWRTALTSVEAGIYTLRVDEVDSAGKVVSRVETPFRREAPEVLAKLTKAQAAETQGAETQGAATQGAETQTTEAQTAEAQTAEAQTAEAQATEPQATEPQAAGAQATEAQAAGMPATETQATETQATETQATEPQAAGTQAAETQAAGTQPKQASATAAAAAPQPAPKRVQAITVQPGNTLWAIARERYGSGMLYVRLFDANKDAIRDPDLIYPGQVFTIPD